MCRSLAGHPSPDDAIVCGFGRLATGTLRRKCGALPSLATWDYRVGFIDIPRHSLRSSGTPQRDENCLPWQLASPAAVRSPISSLLEHSVAAGCLERIELQLDRLVLRRDPCVAQEVAHPRDQYQKRLAGVGWYFEFDRGFRYPEFCRFGSESAECRRRPFMTRPAIVVGFLSGLFVPHCHALWAA